MTVSHDGDIGSPPTGQPHEQLDLLAMVAEVEQDEAGGDDQAPPLTLIERFEKFDSENPHIYPLLVRLCREWVRRTGRHKIGIAMLWEKLRWELSINTTESEPVLNNDYKAAYARLIMRREPDLAGLFDLRHSEFDEMLGEVTRDAA